MLKTVKKSRFVALNYHESGSNLSVAPPRRGQGLFHCFQRFPSSKWQFKTIEKRLMALSDYENSDRLKDR